MAMKIVNGVPTYDNESEWSDAHTDWMCDGFDLHCEKDAFLYEGDLEDHAKLEAELMARQPKLQLTETAWDLYVKSQSQEDAEDVTGGMNPILF